MPVPAAPFLYAVVDAGSLGGRDPSVMARSAVEGGARMVQARAKGLSDRDLVAFAGRVVAGAHGFGVPVIVNDRPDVACLVDADGVHVGQDDLSPEDARRVVGPARIVGVSTHDAAQLDRALSTSADYVAVGPVFATTTKAQADPVVGTALVARAAAQARGRAIVGIGGITRANAAEVVAAGASGVAVIGDLFRDPDVHGAARALLVAVGGSPR